jgi:glucokinase
LYLGIDIGGTRLKAGLVDEGGVVWRSAQTASPASREALESTLPALVRQLLADGVRPRAVGFGCKGIIDAGTTEVRTLPGVWSFLVGLRLSETVSGLVDEGTPIAADNDAKAALAGEVAWGAARGRRNVLLLTLGTGVGGAILVDGRILRGAADVAGHLGHMCAEPDGAPCICGNHGCLETVFSSRAIEAEAWSAAHRGCKSPMTEILWSRPEALSCQFVFEQAALGDAIARRLLDQKIRVLGACLAGLIHTMDPEVVILSGSIADAGAALFQPLQREVDWRVGGLLKRQVPLVSTGVDDTSGVVGACGLARMALEGGL